MFFCLSSWLGVGGGGSRHGHVCSRRSERTSGWLAAERPAALDFSFAHMQMARLPLRSRKTWCQDTSSPAHRQPIDDYRPLGGSDTSIADIHCSNGSIKTPVWRGSLRQAVWASKPSRALQAASRSSALSCFSPSERAFFSVSPARPVLMCMSQVSRSCCRCSHPGWRSRLEVFPE